MARPKKHVNAITTCEHCGKESPFPKRLSSGAMDYTRHRFCSNTCANLGGGRDKIRHKPPTFTCAQCGKIVERNYNRATQGYNYKAKFCSQECSAAAQFRGGHVHHKGYLIIKGREHHRTVMEQVLGRPLESWETVHHKDGDKLNNNPENLELWSSRHPKGQRVTDVPDEDIWNGMTPRWALGAAL